MTLMSEIEPGLDLHEWETRWAQLEEALAEERTSPRETSAWRSRTCAPFARP
jgi:hypothetical protein